MLVAYFAHTNLCSQFGREEKEYCKLEIDLEDYNHCRHCHVMCKLMFKML
jgi:hypothetical protein